MACFIMVDVNGRPWDLTGWLPEEILSCASMPDAFSAGYSGTDV